jgi:peptide/nickel transport system permease protein
MFAYFLSRAAQAALVMLMVALVAFVISSHLGDPVSSLVGQDTDLADRAALRHALGVDRPLPALFAGFVVRFVHGDLGTSWHLRRPVSELLVGRLPATLELVLVASILALSVGIPLGAHCAAFRDGWLDRAVLAVSLLGVSVPTFIVGVLLIQIFAVQLGWLPAFGRGRIVRIGFWTTGLLTVEGWRAIILPATTLALYQLALVVRLVRSEMIEVLASEPIRFARARGLTDRAIHLGHALRNALLPVVTIAGLQIGSLIAFSVVTETVFQWPGLGLLLIQAVVLADTPVLTAYLVLVALLFVAIGLVVDLLCLALDPRLRRSAAFSRTAL